MTDLISLNDLDASLDREPRIRDVVLAERLGIRNPHSIRDFIDRNRAELEGYGPISSAMRMVEIGSGARRPVDEYWLNEGQALAVCALSRTAKAAAVRRALIEVFMAWRQGKSAPARTPPGTQELSRELRRAINRRASALSREDWERYRRAMLSEAGERLRRGQAVEAEALCVPRAALCVPRPAGEGLPRLTVSALAGPHHRAVLWLERGRDTIPGFVDSAARWLKALGEETG